MDMKRKKELIQEWKNRRPEMGVISFQCTKTNEAFLGISTDMKASFNSIRFQLSMGVHPNKRMMELWSQYGEETFECSVMKVLKYENVEDNHTEELEKLLEECLTVNPQAVKIWNGTMSRFRTDLI